MTNYIILVNKKEDEILKAVGLENDAHKKVSSFSKGMRSRLNFIKCLLHNPDILFLDEPTSGLDPNNSNLLKEMIAKEKASGKTIIITTHNMHDAAQLCDHVAFIVDGHIQKVDTPMHFIQKASSDFIHYTYLDKTLLHVIKNIQLVSIHSQEATLEDVFTKITGRKLV